MLFGKFRLTSYSFNCYAFGNSCFYQLIQFRGLKIFKFTGTKVLDGADTCNPVENTLNKLKSCHFQKAYFSREPFIPEKNKCLEKRETHSLKDSHQAAKPEKEAKSDFEDCRSQESFNSGNSSFSDFVRDENGLVVVYTDGACINNGKEEAKAGIGVWFNFEHPLNVSAPAEGRPTSNNAEIQAARIAICQALKSNEKKISIQTDSKFLINCITRWIFNWRKNNWKLTKGGRVKNKVELVKLNAAMETMAEVKWNHVAGHKGTIGNEMANILARKGAELFDKDSF